MTTSTTTTTTTTTATTTNTTGSAMAAAVAAAAQLAMSGGMQLYASSPAPMIQSATAQVFSALAAANDSNNKKQKLQSKGINNNATTNSFSKNSSQKSPLSTETAMKNDKTILNTHGTTPTTTVSLSSSPTNAGDSAGEEGPEEDAEQRLARSRERNREHARRTRIRKKAQLEALQDKVKALEQESQLLRQSIEECSIASILMGLSNGKDDEDDELAGLLKKARVPVERKAPKVSLAVAGKRKRFVSEGGPDGSFDGSNSNGSSNSGTSVMSLKMDDGTSTLIIGGGGTGKTHINWKSGVYCDENGQQRRLTKEQLENLRRERNRMHAKMTRDRKKSFINAIEKNIEELEVDNARMRQALEKIAAALKKKQEAAASSASAGTAKVTPISSPGMRPTAHPENLSSIVSSSPTSTKQAAFSLTTTTAAKPTAVPTD